jgi:hypothetical protein
MKSSSENTDKIQKKKFSKGYSGNPNGRPKGSLNKATLAIKNMFDGEAEEVGRKAIEMAKNGDMQAIKLIIERIIAPRKENLINFDFSEIESGNTLIQAGNSIMLATSQGQITISEAKELFSILDSMRKNIEIESVEKRLSEIENRLKK